MLNEEKIRLMTKLALYEEKNGKKALSANMPAPETAGCGRRPIRCPGQKWR